MDNETTAFEDWFDIMNKGHLEALAYHLPKHFLPADVGFTGESILCVLRRISDAWIEMHTKTTRSFDPNLAECIPDQA